MYLEENIVNIWQEVIDKGHLYPISYKIARFGTKNLASSTKFSRDGCISLIFTQLLLLLSAMIW